MTKKRSRPMHSAACTYAGKRKAKNAAPSWNDTERGTYWWGLYEGYQAGVRAERRRK